MTTQPHLRGDNMFLIWFSRHYHFVNNNLLFVEQDLEKEESIAKILDDVIEGKYSDCLSLW